MNRMSCAPKPQLRGAVRHATDRARYAAHNANIPALDVPHTQLYDQGIPRDGATGTQELRPLVQRAATGDSTAHHWGHVTDVRYHVDAARLSPMLPYPGAVHPSKGHALPFALDTRRHQNELPSELVYLVYLPWL